MHENIKKTDAYFLKSCTLRVKPVDNSMNAFLKYLEDRRFKKRQNFNGTLTNMNIVVACLNKNKRQKILKVKGDTFEINEDFDHVLNNIVIGFVEMSKGVPLA